MMRVHRHAFHRRECEWGLAPPPPEASPVKSRLSPAIPGPRVGCPRGDFLLMLSLVP